jgi:hypothetical protein
LIVPIVSGGLDEDDAAVILQSLCREHTPAESVEILDNDDRPTILASLRNGLECAEFVLMEQIPNSRCVACLRSSGRG